MNKAVLLYPLGDLNKYEEVTYIYKSDKLKSKLPVIWLCEKMGDIEEIAFIITKRSKETYFHLFNDLYKLMLNKNIEDVFQAEDIKRFRRMNNFEEDKKVFLEKLTHENAFTFSFMVIDEKNLTSFIRDIKVFMKEHKDYTIHTDITHGYRFIPMFLTIAISLLKNTQINLRVGEILYAFGGSSDENEIVSLKDYLDVLDWSQRLYTFKNAANITPIAESLKILSAELSAVMEILQASLDMNLAPKIKDSLHDLKVKLESYGVNSDVFSGIILEDLQNMLSEFNIDGSQSDFEISLSKWHLKNRRYLHGYIALIEAMTTKLCEAYGYDYSKRDERLKAKNIANPIKNELLNSNEGYKRFVENYIKENEKLYAIQKPLSIFFNKLSEIRNCFAHIKDISTDDASRIYEKAKDFPNSLKPSIFSSKIKWQTIEDIIDDIQNIPSLLNKEKVEELSNIYRKIAKEDKSD